MTDDMTGMLVFDEIERQMERIGVYVETLTPYEASWVVGALADGLMTQVGSHANLMSPVQIAMTTYLYARIMKRCAQRALPARERRPRTDLVEGVGQLLDDVTRKINEQWRGETS